MASPGGSRRAGSETRAHPGILDRLAADCGLCRPPVRGRARPGWSHDTPLLQERVIREAEPRPDGPVYPAARRSPLIRIARSGGEGAHTVRKTIRNWTAKMESTTTSPTN